MQYRIEDIIKYVEKSEYSFEIREYADQRGNYYVEAVVFTSLVSDLCGIIIEIDPFSPSIYYTYDEITVVLDRLEKKSIFMLSLIKEASLIFNSRIDLKLNKI